jgi:hypothetical protein
MINIITSLLLLIAILTNTAPTAGRVSVTRFEKAGLAYDLYLPLGTKKTSNKALLLAHGMVAEGGKSPLLVLVASNLAAVGRIPVMVPDNKGLMASQLGAYEVAEARLALIEMARLFPGKRRGVMSFCYANGVVLSALRGFDKCPVDFLVLWGSYANLTDATMYSLTGFYRLKDSLLYAEPDNDIRNRYFHQRYWYLPFQPHRREIIQTAVIKGNPAGLHGGEKPVFDFLRNTDHKKFNELFQRLPEGCKRWQQEMSALNNLGYLHIPAIFVHSKQDVVVPYQETVKLYDSYLGRKKVFLLDLLEHVDPLKFSNSLLESLRGILQYYRFLAALLAA